MVQTERLRPLLVVAPQSHRLLLAAVPLPASEAQEVAQRAVAAEVAVQSTAAEERAAELPA